MCFSVNNTLLIDTNHRTPATAQASSDIIRCALAAIAVAVLQDVMNKIGIGWTFTLLGFGVLGSAALYWVERQWGMEWRTAEKDAARNHETVEKVVKVEEHKENNSGVVEPKEAGLEGIAEEGRIESQDALANRHQGAEDVGSTLIRNV